MSDVIRIRLPPEKARQENRLKFLAAIRRFGKWRDSQKISRPYLERLLTRVKNDPQFDPVHEYLKDLPLLPNDSIVSTSHDLDPKWFEKNWPRNSKGPVKIEIKKGVKKSFHDLKHDELIYAFRNSLVHETRALSREAEIPPHSVPFYHRKRDTTVRPHRKYWVLKHPPKFLETLALNILHGMEDHFRKRKVNPCLRLWNRPDWASGT
jgi:hypothetical protein